jgi:phage-related holin
MIAQIHAFFNDSLKTKYFAILIAYLIFFFSPIVAILIATGVLVFTDLFTGVFAAARRGEKVDSKKMARSVSKIIFYFTAIILSRMMETVFFPSIPIASITSGYIALIEFKSNIENISSITGLDIWKALIDKIQNFRK